MGRCKNCRHYFEHFNTERDNYGACMSSKFIYDNDLDLDDELEIVDDDCLLYGDSEQYSAYFEVGENFGCVHFKRKE